MGFPKYMKLNDIHTVFSGTPMAFSNNKKEAEYIWTDLMQLSHV